MTGFESAAAFAFAVLRALGCAAAGVGFGRGRALTRPTRSGIAFFATGS